MSMVTTTIRMDNLLTYPLINRIPSAIVIEILATIQLKMMINLRGNSVVLKVLMTMRRRIASKPPDFKKLQEICKYWLPILCPNHSGFTFIT